MKINNFMTALESALVERGVSEDTAKKHVANLSRSFTSDDLSEIEAIESSAEVAALADSIAAILNKNKKTVTVTQNQTAVNMSQAQTAQVSAVHNKTERPSELPVSHNKSRVTERKPIYAEPEPDYFDDNGNTESSGNGPTIFWVTFGVTLPITLALLLIAFGAFVAAFGALIGIIVCLVALLIAIVAAGAAASLVGIIYGITQLFSFPAAGIYEIGLGVMVAGAVLFASILIYNLAIRFIPWVISWLAVFFKYSCKKLIVLFNYVRKECYKL